MTQRELEREVARQTGESIHSIRKMGFSPLEAEMPFEERQEPLMVDWELRAQEYKRQRRSLI
jgi:hypothetical protein